MCTKVVKAESGGDTGSAEQVGSTPQTRRDLELCEPEPVPLRGNAWRSQSGQRSVITALHTELMLPGLCIHGLMTAAP